MEKDSFVFYRSFYEAVRELDPQTKLALLERIITYALWKEEPTEEPSLIERAIFATIKPQLDANWKRFINGCKGGQYGHLGGAPIGNQNAKKNNPEAEVPSTPKQPLNNPKTTPNVNVNVNDNDNVNVYNKKKTITKKDAATAASVSVSVSDYDVSTDYGKFRKWIEEKCPSLNKMIPPTEANFITLREKYQGDKFQKVWNVLLEMENYKDTAKKNKYIYRTLVNWLNRREQNNGSN